MSRSSEDAVARYLRDSCVVLERAADDVTLRRSLAAIADRIARTFRDGGKVLLAGNGGSAADAQHIAAEFLSRFKLDRSPLPAIALTTDSSVLTAIGNDYGFAEVFERQVRALGRAGDVFIAISTSGRSENVLAALRAARELGLTTVGFTGGSGGDMHALCEFVCAAPSDDTALIQQVHLVAAHVLCLLVEQDLFGAAQARPELAAAGTRAP
ncbi:MAG TPA: D-sedoheptulose 7-phosphate isomerase [Xanthobacteraceae bacterium]|jgi:D-sedoheptulose 7-phosphate isomerase|nr:D-sedoheptulose 7-phosphate isomerase [Xanthobacteraceae bacterium]